MKPPKAGVVLAHGLKGYIQSTMLSVMGSMFISILDQEAERGPEAELGYKSHVLPAPPPVTYFFKLKFAQSLQQHSWDQMFKSLREHFTFKP